VITAGLLVLLVALIALRQPIVLIVAVAVAYVHAFMAHKGSVEFLIQDVWYTLDREVLLSIPLFVLAGLIMARGSIAGRLVRVMRAFTGPLPGGLGIATVLALTVFSAVCGASSITMLAVGSIMYPALLANGYDRKFALGLLCAGGTLGVIIPPSLLMIIYGITTETSITDLFKAGWGPGLLLSGALCVYTVIVSRGRATEPLQLGELGAALADGVWALLMPVILLGGIYSGFFTVTESAAVSVVYALAVELVIYRELRAKHLLAVMIETLKMLGSLMPLIAIAASLNNVLDLEGVPHALVKTVQSYVTGPILLLVIVNVLLLVAGALMDESSAILVLAPLLAPLGKAYGFDAIHFGTIFVVNLQIGYVAPPMALNLIVAMVAFKEPFGFVCRAVIPFTVIMLVVLVVVSVFPQVSLFLLTP
jgi:C4-dicarboxylate transporter DctM subunit